MLTLALIIALGAIVYFWCYIKDFFQKHVIPLFRQYLGNTAAGIMAAIVIFCDKGICWTRSQIKQAWRWFKSKVLGMKTEHKRVTRTQVEEKTTIHTTMENGKILETIKTTIKDWEEVPYNVKKHYMMNNVNTMSTDDKGLMAHAMQDAIRKNGVKNENGFQEKISEQELAGLLEIQIA